MNPKLFISYSWSSQAYADRVLQLATSLRGDGVDVIIDRWDLKEGHDAKAFMESMVTAEDIKRVALLCDPAYAKKANQRIGGVGTETQIVTTTIFAKTDQDKFVAVLMERDEEDKPALPVYMANRIYIDLSKPELQVEEYDKLLRWVYGKPLFQKPELGKPPAFLSDTNDALNLETTSRYRRALEALRSGNGNAAAFVSEFFSSLVSNLEKIRLSSKDGVSIDASMVRESVASFSPYRNEVITIIDAIATFADNVETRRVVKRFLEALLPYRDRPEGVNSWNNGDFDNFKIISHEIYLYTIAIYLKHERFDAVGMLSSEFYDAGMAAKGHAGMGGFSSFRPESAHFEDENSKKQQRSVSPIGTYLKDRNYAAVCPFIYLMQADFFLWLKSKIKSDWWYPATLVYSYTLYQPFEIFARSQSKGYVSGLCRAFGIEDADSLKDAISASADRTQAISFNYNRLEVGDLANLKRLATTD